MSILCSIFYYSVDFEIHFTSRNCMLMNWNTKQNHSYCLGVAAIEVWSSVESWGCFCLWWTLWIHISKCLCSLSPGAGIARKIVVYFKVNISRTVICTVLADIKKRVYSCVKFQGISWNSTHHILSLFLLMHISYISLSLSTSSC